MRVFLKEKLTRFGFLSDAQISKIISCASTRSYKKGDYFLSASSANTEPACLISGVFRHYAIDNHGEENTLMFITEGDFFAELKSFNRGMPLQEVFQAETDAEVLLFTHLKYKGLISEIPGLESICKQISQEKLTKELRLSREIVALEAKEAYLLLLKECPEIVSRVPDKHLAGYLGITKHSLSRIKKKIMMGNIQNLPLKKSLLPYDNCR